MSFSHEITASWDRLFDESKENAGSYLHAAIKATEILPKGVDRTALIVAYMHAASSEMRTAAVSVAAQKVSDALSALALSVESVASAVEYSEGLA